MKNIKMPAKPLSMYYTHTIDLAKRPGTGQNDRPSRHSQFKKSSSLPIYYVNKTRMREITDIYRSMSTDKIAASAARTRRNSPSLASEKQKTPFTQVQTNSLMDSKQKGRLTIQRGNENAAHSEPTASWAQLAIKLRSITDRLQEMLSTKSQDTFIRQMEKYLENLQGESKKRDYSGREELLNCVRLLGECMGRREKVKIAEVRASYHESVDQIATLQSQIKKKSIRAMLDQRQIQKQQQKVMSLEQELNQLKKSQLKVKKQACFGTEDKDTIFIKSNDGYAQTQLLNTQLLTLTPQDGFYARKCCNCKEELQRKEAQLETYLKKLQSLNRKQKDLLAVLVVLRGEGVNIEQIYNDVLSGSIEVAEQDSTQIGSSLGKIRKEENRMYKKIREMAASSDIDADNSIISSADGLSFNYDEKSLVEDVFTVRREYKCNKQLQPEMKKKLKLNFDILYDEQLYDDDYQSEEEEGIEEVMNPPTI